MLIAVPPPPPSPPLHFQTAAGMMLSNIYQCMLLRTSNDSSSTWNETKSALFQAAVDRAPSLTAFPPTVLSLSFSHSVLFVVTDHCSNAPVSRPLLLPWLLPWWPLPRRYPAPSSLSSGLCLNASSSERPSPST